MSSQRHFLRGKGTAPVMQGMLMRWTASRGIGTILGRDAQDYVITAPILRRSNIIAENIDAGKAKGGKSKDMIVDDVIQESGRVWDFTWSRAQSEDKLPEINYIWKNTKVRITPEQWQQITGTRPDQQEYAGKGKASKESKSRR